MKTTPTRFHEQLLTWLSVYALDKEPDPSADFDSVQERAKKELGGRLHYRQLDVREDQEMAKVFGEIGDKHGRLDGLVAGAAYQQEISALEYRAKEATQMFAVNITGVLMTAQAAAKQMIRFGSGGSIAIIGSMSGTVANRVSLIISFSSADTCSQRFIGTHLRCVQCIQSRCLAAGS